MKIEFNAEQYRALLKLVYLGRWVSSGYKGEESDHELDGVEQYIHSFYKAFGQDDWIEYSAKYNGFFPTMAFDEAMRETLDEYDDFSFWNQLAERMSQRDLENKMGKDIIDKMGAEELYEKLDKMADVYMNEFAEHGIDDLYLKKKKPALGDNN